MAQAVEAALQKKPGLAFNTEAEDEDGKPEVEVKILSDDKVWKVELDGATGVAGTPKAEKSEKKGEKGDKNQQQPPGPLGDAGGPIRSGPFARGLF